MIFYLVLLAFLFLGVVETIAVGRVIRGLVTGARITYGLVVLLAVVGTALYFLAGVLF